MRAADNGHSDIVRLLLRAEASVDAKDNVSKRMFIFTYVYGGGTGRGILPSHCMISEISEKYHFILLLHFITICSI